MHSQLTFGDRVHERRQLQVEGSRRKTHMQRVEKLHARAGESPRLGEKSEKKQLPVGTPSATVQSRQDGAEETHALLLHNLRRFCSHAEPVFSRAQLGKCQQCPPRSALAIDDNVVFKQQAADDACRRRMCVRRQIQTRTDTPVRPAAAVVLRSNSSSTLRRTCTARTASSIVSIALDTCKTSIFSAINFASD